LTLLAQVRRTGERIQPAVAAASIRRYHGGLGVVRTIPGEVNRKGLEGEQLRRLMEVGRGLVSNLEVEVVLNRLIEVGREVTGARYAALGILDEERRGLERFITIGIDEDTSAAIGEPPRGHGVLGEVIRDPRALRLENVGDHPRSYGFPRAHPQMSSFLGVPVVIRGEAFGNLYLTEKAAGPFDEADEEAALILADFAAIAIDNARLYTRAESRRSQLERSVRRLEAATEIARALEGDMALSHMLELVAKRGRALVDAQWLVILLADDSGAFEVAAVAGDVSSARVGRRIDAPDAPLQEVTRDGRTRRVTDLSPALKHAIGDGHDMTTPAILVPLTLRTMRFGVLVTADTSAEAPKLSVEDVRLLEAFAASAATAVNTARSVAADRLRHSIEASEAERRRWARELHDETLQGLGGLQLLLSAALRRPPDDLAGAVHDAVGQIGEEIHKLRALITELRPAALDELGLVPAIETLAQRTAAVEALTVETSIDLEIEEGTRLHPEVESALYRLAQEALTNVGKHAGATAVEISLARRDDNLELRVSDDGAGFRPDQGHGGFGLIGMRERATLVGGRLTVESEPGGGTTVTAILPASTPEQPAAV
jgi:signal transduction histidine kinase